MTRISHSKKRYDEENTKNAKIGEQPVFPLHQRSFPMANVRKHAFCEQVVTILHTHPGVQHLHGVRTIQSEGIVRKRDAQLHPVQGLQLFKQTKLTLIYAKKQDIFIFRLLLLRCRTQKVIKVILDRKKISEQNVAVISQRLAQQGR